MTSVAKDAQTVPQGHGATLFASDAPLLETVIAFGGDQVLSLVVRENSKPGRTDSESWTLQATPDWSRRFLASSAQEVEQLMLEAFSKRVGAVLPTVVSLQAHRWRYARPVGPLSSPLWKVASGLGVCGDWLAGNGVDAAWTSGRRLADRMALAGDAHAPGAARAAAPFGQPSVKRRDEPARFSPPTEAFTSPTQES